MKQIIILGASLAALLALLIPAAASASTWRYQKMNRGEQIGFVSDLRLSPHIIGGITHVCPKDRGYVAVSGRTQFGMYWTDCPVGEINGKPEYQGSIIFSAKHRLGAWRALTAGTSPLDGNHYYGAPEHVVATLEHKLFNGP